jgi:poly-gamma-glutamate biosynthesis protein PgsC/CapC
MFENFLAIGIIFSLIYFELTQISPGGLITPGYLALFIDQPIRILVTFLVAIFTYVIVKVLKKYLPIYGRREFAVSVTIAIFLKLFVAELDLGGDFSTLINSIGVIIPGLIANDMLKQTMVKTVYSTGVVTMIMFGVLLIMNGSLI